MLADKLEERARDDKERFISGLDRLYRLICQSSEHVPVEKCKFRQMLPEADWEPVLKHAYIEMISLNCLATEKGYLEPVFISRIVVYYRHGNERKETSVVPHRFDG